MPQSSVAALRAAENDYPLQREVGRITRELNPTSVLTRRRHDLWQRGIVDHFNTAYKAPDGSVKFRSLADIAAARDGRHGDYRRGGGGRRSNSNTKPARSVSATPALVSDQEDVDEVDESTLNSQQLRLRDQQTRRVGREARSQLYKSLVHSERRLKLCKNGVTDPYSMEHVALWDGSSQRRNLSALADPSRRKKRRLPQPPPDGDTTDAVLSRLIEARATTSLSTPVPPRASPPQQQATTTTTLGSKLPPLGRAGARSAPLPAQDDDFASPLIGAVDPDEQDFGAAAVADDACQPDSIPVLAKEVAEAPPEEVGSFFFTQPSFRIAMDASAKDMRRAAAQEAEDEQHHQERTERSNSHASTTTRRLTRGASMIAHAAGPRGVVPPLGRAVAQHVASPGSAASGATRDLTSTAGHLGSSPGVHSKANPSPRTADQLHASAAESLRLRKRFKAVPSQQILSRDYRPPSPGDKASANRGPEDLSSKLRTHPHFQAELYARGDSFHQGARDRFARKQQEQRPKYDKKYRALDVGGAPLPFHATPAAILHHVEAVIQRDERASSRADKYASQLAELQDIAAYLRAHARHPKVATMLDITSGLFGPDRPDPGQDQLFGQTFAALEDSDFLFHDVVDACVHIGGAYGVGEKAIIDHARTRAGRFIHDQPRKLLETMERVDARYTATAPAPAGQGAAAATQSVSFSAGATANATGGGTRATGTASPTSDANRGNSTMQRSRSISAFSKD